MTEPPLPSVRAQRADDWHADDGRTRPRYLPSAQVLTELATLGPDLRKVAEDLRVCLSDPADGRDLGSPITT